MPGEPWHTRHMVREALMVADLIDEKRANERREQTTAPQGEVPSNARFWTAERAAKRRRLIAEQRGGTPGDYLHG